MPAYGPLHRLTASVSPAIAAVLACSGLVGGILLSSRVQSLLVFVQILNWPPFDSDDLTKPSPLWLRRITAILSRLGEAVSVRLPAFEGLPSAVPFSAKGPNGTVRGLHLPRAGPGRHTVLYLHGNGGNIALRHRVELYEVLAAPPLCCDVYAIDYVSFGNSDAGWPDEASAVSDATAALEALPVSISDVVVFGHSLGSGIAIGALDQLLRSGGALPKQLVLEAPFTSVPDVAASWVSWLPATLHCWVKAFLHSALAAHRFPSLERIEPLAKRIRVDVLHGRLDGVVPYDQGRQLASRAGALLHSFERGHDDIVRDPQFVPVLEQLLARRD